MKIATVTLLSLLATMLLLGACNKSSEKSSMPDDSGTFRPKSTRVDTTVPKALHGEWFYSGRIIRMTDFKQPEIPDELKAWHFWVNTSRAPLNTSNWRSERLKALYRSVFAQLASVPNLAKDAIRISADSLTVPSWLTVLPNLPGITNEIKKAYLVGDTALQYYIGNAQLMEIRFRDSILVSTDITPNGQFIYAVWKKR